MLFDAVQKDGKCVVWNHANRKRAAYMPPLSTLFYRNLITAGLGASAIVVGFLCSNYSHVVHKKRSSRTNFTVRTTNVHTHTQHMLWSRFGGSFTTKRPWSVRTLTNVLLIMFFRRHVE